MKLTEKEKEIIEVIGKNCIEWFIEDYEKNKDKRKKWFLTITPTTTYDLTIKIKLRKKKSDVGLPSQ